MRISEILLNYLIRNQQLSLTGLGTFHLRPGTGSADDTRKVVFPEGSLHFLPDSETPEDPELITAIASETGKFRALASADLDSYIQLGKQMMNISKPFIIEKIGQLQRNYRNEIEFIPYTASAGRTELGKKADDHEEEIRFDYDYLRKASETGLGGRKVMGLLIAALTIGLTIWLGSYFMSERPKTPPANDTVILPPAIKTPPQPAQPPSSTPAPSPALKTESLPVSTQKKNFYVVIEQSKRARALSRYADLIKWGHNVEMLTKDSINFTLRIPIYAPLSDSAQHRDSLSRFFGRKVWIESN